MVLGIIAEYNPFHSGHLFHLRESVRLTGAAHVAAVMSGNFVQRGEPALCDKHARTLMALKGGADAVIELPTLFAASAAGDFAEAAVTLLEKAGIVDCLCFGSENGGLAEIETARDMLDEKPGFSERLKTSLGTGASYPAAFGAAARSGGSDVFGGPNGTLGALYLRALQKLNSNITPCTVKRGDFASASAVRRAARGGAGIAGAVPPFAREILSGYGKFPSLNDYSLIFQYLVKTQGRGWLSGVLGMDEGLENRFARAAGENAGLDEILAAVKTKRYTRTRLQRAALHAVLGITKADAARYKALGGPQYIRVLGFRREKAFLLREIERRAGLPMVVNLKNARTVLNGPALEMLENEIRYTDIYNLARGAAGKGAEYRIGPVIV